MRFILKALLIGVVALTTVSCGKGNGGSNSNAAANQPALHSAFANESVEMYTEKEQAILQTILSPLILHINGDDSDMIAKADGQGSTPFQYQSDVPIYPCRSDYGANAIQFWATLDGFPESANRVLAQWMLNNGWVTLSIHSFSWMGAAGVVTESFQCHQINEKPLRYLIYSPPGADPHHGINLPVLQRVCTKWDFFNAYETEFPGKGKVKVFSGRFEYRLVPLVPGITTSGAGIASVKFMADPDTGTWKMLEYQRSDDNTQVMWNAIPPDAPKMRPPLPTHCPGP
jgi:hypothetical protein